MPAFRSRSELTLHTGEVLHVARDLDAALAAHLAESELDYRCTVVAPDGEWLTRLHDRVPAASLLAVQRDGPEYFLWRTLRPLVASGRFGIVHAHDLASASHAALAALGTDTPLVVSLHAPPREEELTGLVGSFQRWLHGRALAQARCILTPGDAVRADVLRRFPNLQPSADKVVTVPAGIDFEAFDGSDATPLRTQLGLHDETFLVGCPEGGHDKLLATVLTRLDRFKSVPAVHRVRMTASQPELLDQLDLVALLDDDAVSLRLAREALCAGVPVIATDRPALREILRDTPSLLIEAEFASALETGLRQALTFPWFEEAAAYADVALARFSHRPALDQTHGLYARLLRNESPTFAIALAAGG